jgi:hypothetical protein
MLFMKVVSKPTENREEIRKKRTKAGLPKYPGAKVLGEWSTIQNDKVFVLLEVTDPKDLALLLAPYSHLVNDEIYLVMETEKMLELYSSVKK